MLRHDMVETVGKEYQTSNIEAGEYSYVQAAGLKQNYVDGDEKQLREYLEEERAIHPGKKAICILANINNDKIKVWRSFVDDEHILKDEEMLDRMAHYV